MTRREFLSWVFVCSWRGHYGLRVPVDPTLRQTTRSMIRCVRCHRSMPDTHLDTVQRQ